MKNTLVDLMSNIVELTEEEKTGISETFRIETFKKGTDILKEGQIAKDTFYVIKGCIRKYSISDGEEITSAFYTEHQTAANFSSISSHSPSKYYLSCTEETTVSIANSDKEAVLYKKFPRFGELCRIGTEKMMGEKQEELSTFKNSTPKERYLNLLKNRPGLLNRVPQYQLASYLGVKPETLSRIRKRISIND